MSHDESLQLMKTIVALDLGIVPLEMDVSASLQKMEESEARKSKRKFRKIKRKFMTVDDEGKKKQSAAAKNHVKIHIEKIAREILSREK